MLPPRPGRTGAATAREAGPLLPAAAADLAAATRARSTRSGSAAATATPARRRAGRSGRRRRGRARGIVADGRDRGAGRPRGAAMTAAAAAPGPGELAAGPAVGRAGAGAAGRGRCAGRGLHREPGPTARPGLDRPRRQPRAGPGVDRLRRRRCARATAWPRRPAARTARAVVVTAPDDYSDTQLRRLRDEVARVVLVRPGTRARGRAGARRPARARRRRRPGPGLHRCRRGGGRAGRRCRRTRCPTPARPGSSAATTACCSPRPGWPSWARRSCCTTGAWPTPGWPRSTSMPSPAAAPSPRSCGCWPGSDADGSGPASIGDLFPRRRDAGAVVAGRGRGPAGRCGARAGWAAWCSSRCPSSSARPRSSRATVGSTARAGARDRAAAALRRAGTDRLRSTLGLPRGADADQVAGAAAQLLARPAADVARGAGRTRPGRRRRARRAWPSGWTNSRPRSHAAAAQGSMRKERAWPVTLARVCCGCGPRSARRWSGRTPRSPAC